MDSLDVLTKAQRHKAMSHIRSSDTSIEILLRRALWKRGYRYRKNYNKLPGKPDIALTKYRIAIFCDSEFFHGKGWDSVLLPRLRRGNNFEYWEKKIVRNMERDNENEQTLLSLGWRVIRFWGNDIKRDIDGCISTIEDCILDQYITMLEDL